MIVTNEERAPEAEHGWQPPHDTYRVVVTVPIGDIWILKHPREPPGQGHQRKYEGEIVPGGEAALTPLARSIHVDAESLHLFDW